VSLSEPAIEARTVPQRNGSQASREVPTVADPSRYQRIREVLEKANYTDQGVSAALGIENLGKLRERKLPALLRRVSGGSPLEVLIRLFVLSQAVDLASAQRALAPMTVGEWQEMRLADVMGSSVAGRLQLRCYDGWIIAQRIFTSLEILLPQEAGKDPTEGVLPGVCDHCRANGAAPISQNSEHYSV
jgi:hypothetical protein